MKMFKNGIGCRLFFFFFCVFSNRERFLKIVVSYFGNEQKI